MSIDNSIKLAVSNVLKNPVLAVLKEINISKILKESNFIKRDIGYTPFQILLHFIYMLVINKRQSAFIRHSSDAYKKDTYYRFVQDIRYYTAKTTRICPKNQKYGQGGVLVLPWSAKGQDERSELLYRLLFDAAS